MYKMMVWDKIRNLAKKIQSQGNIKCNTYQVYKVFIAIRA